MKSLQTLALSIALLIPAALQAAPADMQQLLTDGQTAYMKGDLTTAKQDFEWVLQMDPHNRAATGYMRMIAVQEAQVKKGSVMEKQLSTLTIPKLDFKEATLNAALDYMKNSANRLSGGKISVSFVVQLPPEQVNTPVTVSLANVPYTEALRYIGNLAGVSFTYEKYAIVVKPAAGGADSGSASASNTVPQPSVVPPGK